MPRRRNMSRCIALGGIFSGMAVAMMLLGAIFPFATFVAPAVAGLLIVPVAVEFGLPTGFLVYVAISILSLFLVPDKEMSMIFVFFLGYYPLIKALLERLRTRVVRIVVKLAIFNASVIAMYALLLFLFPVAYLVEEFHSSGLSWAGVLLAAGNLTFFIYDVAVGKMIGVYLTRLRPRLIKMH